MNTFFDLTGIHDYHFEVDRNKIRFNGIGPRLHDRPGKIWPRDSIDPNDECRKILGRLDNNRISQPQIEKISAIIKGTFEALRRCNIDSLFNKFCKLDHGHFGRISFSVHSALDAYTTYNQIVTFIHHVIRSINSYKPNLSIMPSDNGRNRDFVRTLFGCNKNYDIFKRHVKFLVTANAKSRKVTIGHFISFEDMSMDLTEVTWLTGLEPQLRGKIFIQLIFAFTRLILELLRRYFYITVSNPYSDMLFYFRYDLWQKIHLTTIKQLDDEKVLVPFAIDENNMNVPFSAFSKLKFFLKKDGLRPICTKPKNSRNTQVNSQLQAILRHILAGAQHFQKFNLIRLLEGLRHFRGLTEEGHRVFFVRADIKNCFQSVQQERLRTIINDSIKSITGGGDIELFRLECLLARRRPNKILKWSLSPSEVSGNNKIISIAQISSVKISLEKFDTDYLSPHIMNPILRESKDSKNGLSLVKGLRQGSPFSPLFCSIYIQAALNHYLGDFLNSEECKIFRYVDDILFMTTNIDMAKSYMHCMLLGFKQFNLRMNLDKLDCNFTCRGLDEAICRIDNHVVFYKQRILLDTLQCSYHYDYEGIELQYTFPVSPYASISSMENLIKKSRVEFVHLDFQLNGFEQVLRNIFERALFFAHRAATTFLLSFYLRNLRNQAPKLVVQLAKLSALRLFKAVKLGSEIRGLIKNDLTRVEVLLLTAAAFRATWNRNQVRHRVVERKKIEIFTLRSMMRYLATSNLKTRNASHQEPLPDSRRLFVESSVNNLVKNFPKSSFAKEVTLPKK